MIKGKILVGHAIHNDLMVLHLLNHPKELIRDTSNYKPFKEAIWGKGSKKTPGLKNLSEKFLGVKIQRDEHSSVEDSQAAMRLYMMFMEEWEEQLKDKDEDKKGGKKDKNEVKKDAKDQLKDKNEDKKAGGKNGKNEEKKDDNKDAKKDNKKVAW